MYEYILLILFIVIVVIIGEISGYVWHRWMAHADFIPGVHASHRIHHNDDTIKADIDFIWLAAFTSVGFILAGTLASYGYLPEHLTYIALSVWLLVILWNYYIHKQYHTEDSYFNRFEWYQKMKRDHYVHHEYPTKNYGIASMFTDKLLGTYQEA